MAVGSQVSFPYMALTQDTLMTTSTKHVEAHPRDSGGRVLSGSTRPRFTGQFWKH